MRDDPRPPTKPKLADVARAAEVSLATASNVFSHPERVRPALRERVEQAAQTLGYLGPDPTARVLRAGKVNAIGLIPPGNWGVHDTLRNPVSHQLLLGVSQACDEAGANLLIISDLPRAGPATAVVDGFIFARVEHMRDVAPAQLRRLPFVVLDSDPGPEVNSVRVDARAGSAAAARHLLELGHRRFAVMSFLRDFAPPQFHPPGRPRPAEAAGMEIDQEKLAGFAEALAEAGIGIDEVPMVQAHPWERDAARMILDVAPEATAILSMSAMQAIAVMDEARLRGRVVPRDLSVVGYNDIPEAARANPPLTTVDGMNAEKGRVAGRLLLGGGPIRREVLPTRLIVRASTAPPR
jgi:DNA-binding LacI/PurR family transcriptional regulator